MATEAAVLQLRCGTGFFGAENVVLEIAKGLRRTRYRPIVGVLAADDSMMELAHRADQAGIESVIFQCNGQVDFRTVAAIKRFVRKNNVGIVQAHGYKADTYTLAATRRLPMKRIATCHPWTSRSYSRRSRFYAWVDQTLLTRFDRVVAVCEQVKAEILQTRVRPEAIGVIENGIDIERFDIKRSREELRRELKLPSDRFLVGTIGRLVPEKAHHFLAKAAAMLRDACPEACYIIAGDGPLLAETQRLVADLGVSDRFRFLGNCDRVPELLHSLDVFVLPSISEGLPMVLLEAMAAHKPIIASKVGGIPQALVHEQSGLLIDPIPSSLADGISRLMRNPNLARRLAQNGFERVRSHYSSERMAQKYVEIYDEFVLVKGTAREHR